MMRMDDVYRPGANQIHEPESEHWIEPQQLLEVWPGRELPIARDVGNAVDRERSSVETTAEVICHDVDFMAPSRQSFRASENADRCSSWTGERTRRNHSDSKLTFHGESLCIDAITNAAPPTASCYWLPTRGGPSSSARTALEPGDR